MAVGGWAERLAQKTVGADDAVAVVESGMRVYIHSAAATPATLVAALTRRAPELRGVRVTHIHTEGDAPYLAPELAGSFRHEALFVGPNARAAINDGRADYIPMFLSEIPTAFRTGVIPIDVAFLNVSMPDAHGYCSLGVSVDCSYAAAMSAKLVVAQLNAAMPRALGQGFIHVDRIARAVLVDEPPASVDVPPPTDIERRIGAHVASLVDDGATLQLGIGAIPNAVLAALTGHRDLGVHTEMFSDGVVDLVERGVITGARNPLNPGKVVTAFVMGSSRLYQFVDDNPLVEMYPVEYTNDTAVIRRNFRMTAINSALEVDLTGQVCASSIGDRVYSGIGGQVDFMRGAVLGVEGRAIIALPSTARGGAQSRITGHLHPGAMLTLTQGHVHYIVTEYGIADLYARSLTERARALIAIAHPHFRAELEEFAHALKRL